MGLEDTVQQQGERLLQRIRDLSEPEIRAFVSDMLTSAATERASVLDETRRLAKDEQGRAVRDESARIRAEVEQAWAAKLRKTSAAAEERQAAELRDAQKLAHRQLSEKVTSVRSEGQRVLEAALEAARHEADRTLAVRLERLREEAERTLVAELEGAAAEAEAAVAEAKAMAPAEAVVPAPEPLPPPPPIDDVVIRVRDGIRRLDRVSRLTDALDALGELAGREASRAAVLTVQDDRVRGWWFTAFEPALEPAHQVDMKIGEAGLVGHAVVTGATHSWVSDPDTASGDGAPAFTVLPVGARALAVPVLVGGQVMAVLYGDDAAREPAAAWRASLEILASHAGHCLESLTAVRAAQLVSRDMPAVIVDDPGPTLPFGADDDDGVGP